MYSTTTEDQSLLGRLAQGNRTAFWQVWIKHQNYLYHRCLSWVGGDIVHAQDALSQAMLKAWDKLPQHAEKIINLKAWLTRFTHNLCLDIQRERRRREVGIERVDDIAVQASDVLNSEAHSPESIMMRDELSGYIHRAIDSLSDRLRIPFKLRFFNQLSYQEIAQRLSISIDNAYKRIQQARKILQKHLRQYLMHGNCLMISEVYDNPSKPPNFEIPTISQVLLEKNIEEEINYQVTAICLESPLPA